MARIYLCFVWHMHQPFYKDLITGVYKLPWTRMHGLKDYYGMVRILKEFPEVHQTFNLVPSLVVQLEEYASGRAADPFLRCALKPAETLTDEEQRFLLQYFFQANPSRLIYRYPRYGELYEAWHAADRKPERARHFFAASALRDLQVLSQLAWFDEEFVERDPEVRALIAKGRDYHVSDQELMGRKQVEILSEVMPAYKRLAQTGQVEISTTPFYHPILPLLCDSNIAEQAHPYIPLPTRFQYPADARAQLERARRFTQEKFGAAPMGLWPSEGSVSDEVLAIAADVGFNWIASDNGVLARSLQRSTPPEISYRPFLWRQGLLQIHALFRDHYLSDLIGFIYARMGAREAADDFLNRIRENCRPILASGRDALVPIILDGENAWEYYELNGRPFLRELYQSIMRDPQISALTVTEALARMEPQVIDHVFPGSWINANFDVWIGADEDNTAWEYLLRARQAYERAVTTDGLADEAKRLAFEELMIAEGSDWCWWYGPEHESGNRPEFDQLFRVHLANVYRLLQITPPDELSRPILRLPAKEFHEAPTGPIRPTIDGEVTSYFEWLGAGAYRVDARSGAMHGQQFLIRELYYGSDGKNLYLRIDFQREALHPLTGMELRIQVRSSVEASSAGSIALLLEESRVVPVNSGHVSAATVEAAFDRILELRVPLAALSVATGQSLSFQLSLWQNGLPMDALPPQGWLEFSTLEPSEWPI
jgi:alpha-amylase/alpha-mannosidase (GH57 family)